MYPPIDVDPLDPYRATGTSARCRHCLTLALGVCLSRTGPPATHPAGRPARASRDPCGPGRRMAHHRRERHEWERVLDEPCPLSAAGGDAPGWRPHPLPAAQVGGAAMTGAELLVRCLDREGVEYVFGVPGEQTFDLNNALADSK